METIAIRNIGPIINAKFALNSVNIFIGPQSSGKSTIAKIVSFCQWLEKYVLINQDSSSVDADFIHRQLVMYHGFEKYFSDKSYILYEGSLIRFEYKAEDNFSISPIADSNRGLMSKVAYIPSERNILGLPNISSLQFGDTYLRSFIFDWLSIRNKYNRQSMLRILNLGVSYYYDKDRGDMISLGDGKELSLSESSSGLQALVPMLVYINYVTKWIYKNDSDISFDKYSALQKALLKNLTDKVSDDAMNNALKDESFRLTLNRTLSNLAKINDEELPSTLKGIVSLVDRIGKPHSTKLSIEESEINIFPSTQYQFVKHLIDSMDFSRGDTLLLTTHSPYILTSINNLIQAGNASRENNIEEEKIVETIPRSCWLQYDQVSAWAVSHGEITSIKDDEFNLISSDAIDRASEEIASDFSKMI